MLKSLMTPCSKTSGHGSRTSKALKVPQVCHGPRGYLKPVRPQALSSLNVTADGRRLAHASPWRAARPERHENNI